MDDLVKQKISARCRASSSAKHSMGASPGAHRVCVCQGREGGRDGSCKRRSAIRSTAHQRNITKLLLQIHKMVWCFEKQQILLYWKNTLMRYILLLVVNVDAWYVHDFELVGKFHNHLFFIMSMSACVNVCFDTCLFVGYRQLQENKLQEGSAAGRISYEKDRM